MKENNVTKEYVNMLEAFYHDFDLAKRGVMNLSDLNLNDEKIYKDITLLGRLAYSLRNGNMKIVKVEEND